MHPWSIEWAGRLEESLIDSQALRGNPLGDPSRRPIWVYLPPGYDREPERRYHAIYVIQGFTSQVDMWRNRSAFGRNFPEMVDELMARGEAPRCLVVFVDCWTSLGGSQYLDSPATGRYHTYLCEDVVPWVDAHYRTLALRSHRGIMGHSSGGYGAMVTPMLRPDLFGGLATLAGDALFEHCYLPEFATVARALRDHYGGAYAMAACYSADSDGTVRLPFEPDTGRLIPEVWERWLAWDPVRMVPRHAETLRSLLAIYIDAGRSDEYFLDLGASAFRHELRKIGASNVRYELFEGTHGGNQHRYPIALRYLAERLAPR